MKQFIKDKIREQLLNEQFEYKPVSKEEFDDVLLNLATLDLEDSQVRYPRMDGKKNGHLFGGNEYDLYVLNRPKLPSSGPFEIGIENNDGEVIGFIRGTKLKNIVSFNMIHIQEENRGNGIGTDIYEKFLNSGFIMKSDSEITDDTYSMYDKLVSYGYKPLLFNDGRVGLVK